MAMMATAHTLVSANADAFEVSSLKRKLEAVEEQSPAKRRRELDTDNDEAESQSSTASYGGAFSLVGSVSTPATPASQSKNWRPYIYHCPRDDCDRVFNRPCRLAEHMRSHTDERPYKCDHPDCDKSFRRDTHLSRHIKTAHSDERNHPCTWPGCDKRFANATRMRRHYSTHEQKERFRCTEYPPCNETFRKHKTLQSHIAAAHLDQKPWPCTHIDEETGLQCTRAYNTESKLRSHVDKTHSGEARFVCSLCAGDLDQEDAEESEARFATQAALREHMQQVHPPRCDECNITFESQGELAGHVDRLHNELSTKAVFHCEEPGCGKSFAKRNNLKEHVRIIHRGEKRFVCGVTDVSGSNKFEDEIDGQTVRHEWSGEGCNRAFGTKATLEEHIRTQHLGLEGSVRARKLKQLRAEGRDPDAVQKLGRLAGGIAGKGSRSRKKATDEILGAPRQQRFASTNPSLPVGKFYFGGLDEDDFMMEPGEVCVDVSGLDANATDLDALPGLPLNVTDHAWNSPSDIPVDPVLQYLEFES